MALGIRPTVDYAFKLLLGSPEHTRVTVHFLNAVLRGSPRIAQATILNPILDKDSDEDKLSVLDIRAVDESGRTFNIEMQTSLPLGLSQRLLYYASCLYVDQLQAGEDYSELRPVISICVLEQSLFPQSPHMHLGFRLRDEFGQTLTDDLQIHLVELPKSRATEHNLRQVSSLESWAFFLRNAEQLSAEDIRALLPEPEFDEAAGVLEMIARTPEQEYRYQARLKAQRDDVARMKFALQQGLKQGIEQGIEQGVEQGIEQGREEGREEGERLGRIQGRIQLLEQLLGLPPSMAEDLAPLSVEELSARADELQQQIRMRIPPPTTES